MLTRFKNFFRSENVYYFHRFVLVFTLIFLLMTAIILQVMQAGIYSSIDESLQLSGDNIERHVNFHMEGKKREGVLPFSPDDGADFFANTEFILYDSQGQILNELNSYSGLHEYKLELEHLDKVVARRLPNLSGHMEFYRSLTVKVYNFRYQEVAYATILVNITQMERTNARNITIIISLMVLFWLVSIFASMHLAKWARRPILESFERQKAFVENASHELRTPLAVLQNRLEGLFRKPDQTILDQSESIAASLEEVRNMKLLTSNLLDLARRDDGLIPEVEWVGATFFEDVFSNYQLIAEEADKILSSQIKMAVPIKTDPTLFKQVLTILVDNAIKYTDDQGEIDLKVSQNSQYLWVTVADNGLGIPDADKPKIFDRFYRVDKARTRQKGGFGLGLALAKQIADSLNGKISIKDNTPKGSVFTLRLPLEGKTGLGLKTDFFP